MDFPDSFAAVKQRRISSAGKSFRHQQKVEMIATFNSNIEFNQGPVTLNSLIASARDENLMAPIRWDSFEEKAMSGLILNIGFTMTDITQEFNEINDSKINWPATSIYLTLWRTFKKQNTADNREISLVFSNFLFRHIYEPLSLPAGLKSLTLDTMISFFLWLTADEMFAHLFIDFQHSEFILKTFFSALTGRHKEIKVMQKISHVPSLKFPSLTLTNPN
jgi:hypothetical protein